MILLTARPDPPPPEPVTAWLTVRLTKAEKAAVRAAADTDDVSMSAWGRAAVKARLP